MNIGECPICTNLFTNNNETYIPKFLPCGHTFCSSCLFQIFHNHNITCPQCRVSHHIIDFYNIPKNYLVIELLEYNNNNNNSDNENNKIYQNNKKKYQYIEPGEINSNDIDFTKFQIKSLESLTVFEVKNLLINLKLSKFADIFEENQIDGITLAACQSEEDLVQAGINLHVKARILYEKIKQFLVDGVPLSLLKLSNDLTETEYDSPSRSRLRSDSISSSSSLSSCNNNNTITAKAILSPEEEGISIWICGMTDYYEFLNGLYYPTDEIYMGRKRYFKFQYNCWIEYNSNFCQWQIKPESMKGTNTAWAYQSCTSPSTIYPYESDSIWKIYKYLMFIEDERIYCLPHYSIYLAGIPNDIGPLSNMPPLNGYYEPVIPNNNQNNQNNQDDDNNIQNVNNNINNKKICKYHQKSNQYSIYNSYWIEYYEPLCQWQLKHYSDLNTQNNIILNITLPNNNPKEIWYNKLTWTLSSSLSSIIPSDLELNIITIPKLYCIEMTGGSGVICNHICGIYEPSSEVYSEWIRYYKIDDKNCLLEYMKIQNQWHIKPVKDKCTTNAWACIKDNQLKVPCQLKEKWLIYDGSRFNIDEDFKCVKKLPLV